MEIIWTKEAKQDLHDYYKNSRIENTEKLKKYVTSIVEYVDSLATSPRLGKVLYNDKVEVRQLVYKIHKILYSIINNKIYILVVTPSARDTKFITQYLKNNNII